MASLIIETGVKEYDLNDVVTVRFNPTDMNFVKRYYDQIEALENKVGGWEETFKKASGTKEVFSLMEKETKEEQKKSKLKIAKYTSKYKNGSKYHP